MIPRSFSADGLQVERVSVRGPSSVEHSIEHELDIAHAPLPVPQRHAWMFDAKETFLLVARDAHRRLVGGLGVGRSRSRALPGHTIYRCSRVGQGMPEEVLDLLLGALA